jgi:hypothetical protein
LIRGEYALAIVLSTNIKKIGDWTKHHICGDYRSMNKWMHLKKYVMPLLEEILNTFVRPMFFHFKWI